MSLCDRHQSLADHSKLLVLLGFTVATLAGCSSAPHDPDGPNPAAPSTTNTVANLHTQLGIGYLREGKLELAWERLNKALENDPNYSTANNAMGLLNEQLGQPEKAEEHYVRAVNDNPGDSSAQNNFGRFLCGQGRYQEGEEHLRKAVQNTLYKTPQLAYTNAGICARAAQEPDKAEAYFRQALETDPRMPAALYNMAELTFERGQPLSSRAYLQRYLAVAKHTPQSLWLGIQVEDALGDSDAVASYGTQLTTRFPDAKETQMFEASGR